MIKRYGKLRVRTEIIDGKARFCGNRRHVRQLRSLLRKKGLSDKAEDCR